MESQTPSLNSKENMFTELEFPVALEDFQTMDNKIVEGRKIVRRQDTGAVLNVVSKKYQLVPHVDVFQKVQEAVAQIGIPVLRTNIGVGADGGYARVMWTLDKGVVVENGKASDELKIQIIARNSYNYSSLLGLELGTWRLICSNGAMGFRFIKQNSKRHVPSLNVGQILSQIIGMLGQMDTASQLWSGWNHLEYLPARLQLWLEKHPTVISKKARQEIVEYFTIQPDRLKAGEEVHYSGWEAVNALTWFATHRVKTRTAERALVAEEMVHQVAAMFSKQELGN